MSKKYRIVERVSISNNIIYVVQRKYSWWPFWCQDFWGYTNIDAAKKLIEYYKSSGNVVWEDGLSDKENTEKLANKAFDEIIKDDEEQAFGK